MSTTISFISGKGGTGKTTFTLSVADLLWKCGINTLIVDCDLVTNGATYFFEPLLEKIQDQNSEVVYSLSDIVFADSSSMQIKIVKVREQENQKAKLDCIPSVPGFSTEESHDLQRLRSSFLYTDSFDKFVLWAKDNYEVILFDCQAGYSFMLDSLLPLMDINIFVMEADAVSASSMRNLYTKTHKFIKDAANFQVFNKVSIEDFDVYSHIKEVFFPNAGTILFDPKVRDAFSTAEIPNLEIMSKRFGKEICTVCINSISEKKIKLLLQEYLIHLKLLEEKEKYDEANDKLKDLTVENKSDLQVGLSVFSAVLCMAIVLFTVLYRFSIAVMNTSIFLGLFCTLSIFIAILSVLLSFSSKEYRKNKRKLEQDMRNAQKEIKRLEKIDHYKG